MVRAFCLIGMAGGFLAISGDLRNSVVDTFSEATTSLSEHSPYSYIGLGVVVLLGLMFYISRGTAAR